MNNFILILIIHVVIAIINLSVAVENSDTNLDHKQNVYYEHIFNFRYQGNSNMLELKHKQTKFKPGYNWSDYKFTNNEKYFVILELSNPTEERENNNEVIREKVQQTEFTDFKEGGITNSSGPLTTPNIMQNTTMKGSDGVSTTIKDLDPDIINADFNVGVLKIKSQKKRSAPSWSDLLVEEQIAVSSVNPLSITSCGLNCSREAHIACGHNWKVSSKCPAKSAILDLSKHQELILRLHNNFRNELAGKRTKFAPASRMATMQWHNELADYALLNTLRCELKHDWCHKTKEFKSPGQNLAWMTWTNPKTNIEFFLEKLIISWYNEKQHTRQSDLDKFTVLRVGNEEISHFTTMVNDRSTHMGCGATLTIEGRRKSMFFACNYAMNNVLNVPIYVKGPAASRCEMGINQNYTNLCSIKERYV